jgi:hypothetical protein
MSACSTLSTVPTPWSNDGNALPCHALAPAEERRLAVISKPRPYVRNSVRSKRLWHAQPAELCYLIVGQNADNKPRLGSRVDPYRCRVGSGFVMNSGMHSSRGPELTVYILRSGPRSLLRDCHFRSSAGALKLTEDCSAIVQPTRGHCAFPIG